MKMKALALVILGFAATAVGQANRNFWFLNSTGKQIDTVFISPHNSVSWGSDVLGRDVLLNGEGFKIVFTGPLDTCVYDFKFYFSDGTEQEYRQGRDLCNVTAIVFNPTQSFGL